LNKKNIIYLISQEELNNKDILFNFIYSNEKSNYYLSEDFSKDFYIELASFGFITTSITLNDKFYLLPEIQFDYAILDFENLHISKKVKSLLNKDSYEFHINKNINLVLEKLEIYHKTNWLRDKYKNLILSLINYKHSNINFEIMSIELYDKNSQELIAGEIGYKINSIYTSLTGFSSSDKKYNNWGKLQLVLLANYLKGEKFSFWNLGHPYMQYKFDLGAVSYSRKEFLKRWLPLISN
jgi:Leu/Phe-tRNA-protein transferase